MGKRNKFSYKIIPEKKLRIEFWEGKFSLEDKIYFKSLQSKDPLFNPDFDTIQDFRKAVFTIDDEEIEKSRYYPLKNQRFYGKRKIAQLSSTPNVIVYSTLLGDIKSKELQIEIKPFSTLKAAIRWLELNSNDELLVEKTLKDLQSK